MGKHKKRRKRILVTMPYFSFTQETVALAQKTLVLFEEKLKRRSPDEENVQLAKDTTFILKNKLASLQAAPGMKWVVPFDRNEVVLLSTSLQLHVSHLIFLPSSPEISQEIQACYKLQVSFLKLLESG